MISIECYYCLSFNSTSCFKSFQNGNELEGCCHLIESHATCLRMQIFYRNVKSKLRNNVLSEPMINNLDPKDLDTDINSSKMSPKTIVSTLKELPTGKNFLLYSYLIN